VRVAVVGHVEWVEFARVERVPSPGEIVHARETWAEAAGGGAVAAVQLARLAGGATLFTALGGDELGHAARDQLAALGVQVEVAWRTEPQRRAFTFLDDAGERTITLLSRKLIARRSDPLPWDALAGMDAVYFTGGDADALRSARSARVLVATARELETIAQAGVHLDALVRSAGDAGERYEPGDLDPAPALVVATRASEEGDYLLAGGRKGRFEAPVRSSPVVDAYGAGDSFAAGLTFALGERRPLEESLRLASLQGAEALGRRGAHGVG